MLHVDRPIGWQMDQLGEKSEPSLGRPSGHFLWSTVLYIQTVHLHFHLIPTKVQQPKALEVYEQIVEKSAELGGVYSAEHGTGKRKRQDFVKCYGKEAVQEIRQAKAELDPYFLLNRGNIIKYKPTTSNGFRPQIDNKS